MFTDTSWYPLLYFISSLSTAQQHPRGKESCGGTGAGLSRLILNLFTCFPFVWALYDRSAFLVRNSDWSVVSDSISISWVYVDRLLVCRKQSVYFLDLGIWEDTVQFNGMHFWLDVHTMMHGQSLLLWSSGYWAVLYGRYCWMWCERWH